MMLAGSARCLSARGLLARLSPYPETASAFFSDNGGVTNETTIWGHVKVYKGVRHNRLVAVTVHDGDTTRLLDPRFDLANHSPNGFECDDPSQLSLAICADVVADDARALRVYQPFKAAVVADLDADAWQFTEQEFLHVITTVEDRNP